nr:uncharacterized protein LOC111502542 [Leptinotarsa decemlineata]
MSQEDRQSLSRTFNSESNELVNFTQTHDIEIENNPTGASSQPVISEMESGQENQINLYGEGVTGPFTVIVETNKESRASLGRYPHLKIAKEVCDLKLENVSKFKIKGRHNIGVEFELIANSLVLNEKLKTLGYKLYIPNSNVTCKAIVKNITTYYSEEELKMMIKSPYKIKSVKRMNRRIVTDGKIQYVPASTILITFEGTIIPSRATQRNLYGKQSKIQKIICTKRRRGQT